MGFFDGAFGLSKNGKAAQNQVNGYTRDMGNAATDAQNRAYGTFDWANQQQQNLGQFYGSEYGDYGFTDPNSARAGGNNLLPTMDFSGGAQARFDGLGNYLDNRQSTGDIMQQRGGVYDGMNGESQHAADMKGSMINDGYMGIMKRNDGLANDLNGRAQSHYAGLDSANNDTFTGLRGNSAGTFGNLQGTADKTFGNLQGAAGSTYDAAGNRLKTAMDFNNATTASSFAPAKAAANRSLRAAGIDPNSQEGQDRLGNVEAQRGRSFDANQANLISQQNANDVSKYGEQRNLSTSQLANNQQLAQSKLQNDQALGLQSFQNWQNYKQGSYQDQNANSVNLANSQNAAAQGMLGANLDSVNQAHNEQMGIRQQQLGEGVLGRQLSDSEYAQRAGLADAQNQFERGTNDRNYQQGVQQANFGLQMTQNDRAQRQQALNGQNSLYSGMANNGLQWANNAYQNRSGALNASQQQYQQELASSGWGTKILGSALGSGLSAFTGGFGNSAGTSLGKNIFGGGRSPFGFGPAGAPPSGGDGGYG